MSEITNSNGSTDSTAASAIHDVCDPNSDDGIGYTVVTAVAAARAADPVDLPPLYESVDVDAVEALVDGARDRSNASEGKIIFEYAGFEVTVHFDGRLRLAPRGNRSPR